jgi:hypothetical protein
MVSIGATVTANIRHIEAFFAPIVAIQFSVNKSGAL